MKTPKPKRIQDIFNTIIENNIYGHDDIVKSEYMCIALEIALSRKLITKTDFQYARKCISDFFKDHNFYHISLQSNLYDLEEETDAVEKYAMQIYKRWSHRNVLIYKLKAKHENL